MIVLVFVSIVLPYRLAFYEEDDLAWIIAYYVIDFLFLIDMILTFFTTYTDNYTNMEVLSHKKIAIQYFKGWFLIDVLSIMPFDAIFTSKSNINTVIRVSRTSRLYKMLRILRLFKILKMARNDKKLVHNH